MSDKEETTTQSEVEASESPINHTKICIEHISEAVRVIREKLLAIEYAIEELSKKSITYEEYKSLPHDENLVLCVRKEPSWTDSDETDIAETVTSSYQKTATTKKLPKKNKSNKRHKSGK